MSKIIRAIKIDPFNETISEITISADLRGLYQAINCDLVEAIPISDNETLWIDEEGTFKGNQAQFIHLNKPYTLGYYGCAVITGHDNRGNTIDATSDLQDITPQIKFVSPWEMLILSRAGLIDN